MKPNNPPHWQSIDSSQPWFRMPDNWHGRLVDARNPDPILYNVKLVGWIVSDTVSFPYCVTDEFGYTLWVEHIRFID